MPGSRCPSFSASSWPVIGLLFLLFSFSTGIFCLPLHCFEGQNSISILLAVTLEMCTYTLLSLQLMRICTCSHKALRALQPLLSCLLSSLWAPSLSYPIGHDSCFADFEAFLPFLCSSLLTSWSLEASSLYQDNL